MKVYKIYLDGDLGELWLDANLDYLGYVYSNDGHFDEEYYNFLIEHLGVELISLDSCDLLDDAEMENLYELDHGEAFVNILAPKIRAAGL